jgi:predicted O-methyltransferase YrrM
LSTTVAKSEPVAKAAYRSRPVAVRLGELWLEACRSPVGAGLGIGAAVAGLATVIGIGIDLAATLGLVVAAIIGFVGAAVYRLEREVRNASDRVSLPSSIEDAGLGTWAIEADMGQLIAREVEDKQTIVECGSGVTTLLIAQRLRARANGRLFSLEHDPAFAQATSARLDAAGLREWVEVISAPLVEQTFSGRRVQWYAETVIGPRLPAQIDLLVVDGPPAVAPWARWPAIEALHERLAPGAVVLVDDGRRRAERQTAFRWQADHPDLTLYWHDTVKGTWKLVKEGRTQREAWPTAAVRELVRRVDPCPRGFGRWPVRR